MISDVLSDALHAIEIYERELPECYGDISPQINHVKKTMNALRIALDMPPGARRVN